MIELLHTSPVLIDKIEKETGFGQFGDVLFFSEEEYVMTASETVHVYSLELKENQIIEACDLEDSEAVADIARFSGCDDELAEELLTSYTEAYNEFSDSKDGEEISDISWYIQRVQAEAAKRMGYLAVKGEDEQGTVYAICMFEKENLLKLV